MYNIKSIKNINLKYDINDKLRGHKQYVMLMKKKKSSDCLTVNIS